MQTDILGTLMTGLNRIDQAITLFDADLKLIFANDRFLELMEMPSRLGRPGTPFEAMVRWNAEHGEYGAGDLDLLVAERVAAARRFEAHTLERTRPNGVVLKVSGWPLPDGGGFATLYTDITLQRRRELELERRILRRTEQLRRSDERVRVIANEVPAGISYLDRGGVFRFANRRFAAAYGLDPEQVVGRRDAEVLTPDTMARVAEYFERGARGEALAFDIPITFPGGRRLETRTLLRPDQAHDGTVLGFYLLTVNVTREKEAAAALMQAQKMEMLGQLSSGIAHDFNNLLTIILGNLAPLRERLDDEDMAAEMLDPAIRAGRRGAELMRRLLAVARRQPLSPEAVALPETFAGVATLVRPGLGEDVRLLCEPGPTPPVHADPALLETSLINLVINAADACAGGGTIRLSSAPAGDGAVEIRVADDGAGMDAATRARLFEPFYSTKAGRGGTGLGLTMVRGFAADSGGHVEVESAPGRGTRVTLTLPAAPEGTAPAPGPARVAPARLDGRLVLLVDDDAEVRTTLSRNLVAIGAQVLEAESGAEALDLLAAVPGIGALVSDVSMPGMDGVALARRVRTRDAGLPVVLITGYGRDRIEGRLGESLRLLRKPVEAAQIAAAIASWGDAPVVARGET
ncbi:hybrid sensor histidine kinase/response regulator [Limimaricola pyoseonensis]|uniref:histidine kinase n=1 Tax=Limimaricola pyoseonensis TaxID=521013 RepID=A0A1G7DER1_9RHOB|nr:PAS-domain containing protein [Limimaricola pyoseonensis]SDE50011.1 PAS domain S-box-containing protein [Limimaricola pyoseonensis]